VELVWHNVDELNDKIKLKYGYTNLWVWKCIYIKIIEGCYFEDLSMDLNVVIRWWWWWWRIYPMLTGDITAARP
jgi:hypothetical protein